MAKRERKIDFPKHVLEVKEALAASKDGRLDTMKKLTEIKDKQDQTEIKIYHRMWTNLYEEETQFTQDIDNGWVYSFLDDVIKASSLPNFVLKTESERADILKQIKSYNKKLIKLYRYNELSNFLVVNDAQFYGGFLSSDKPMHESMKEFHPEKKFKHPIEIVLDGYLEQAEDEMNQYISRDEKGENAEITRFIHMLGGRNLTIYTKPLNSVVRAATYAIYDLWLNDSKISKKLKPLAGLKKYLNYYDLMSLSQ